MLLFLMHLKCFDKIELVDNGFKLLNVVHDVACKLLIDKLNQ